MKKNLLILTLFCKRQLKRPSFLFILFIFPIFTFLFTLTNQEKTSQVSVALYCEETSAFTTLLMDKLISREGVIHFYICESKEILMNDVAKKNAECGYILHSDLLKKLNQGKRKNQIDLIVSPASTMSKVTNEVFYSELFEEYSLQILKDYTKNDPLLIDFDSTLLQSEIEKAYRIHMLDGSTFSFEYKNDVSTYSTMLPPILLAPGKGMIAVLILLSGFCGAINYFNDKEAHFFDHVFFFRRNIFHNLSITAPVLLATIIGCFCIIFLEKDYSVIHNLLPLFLYAIAVIGFTSILTFLVKNKLFFASMIPIILIGSLVFTPVFLDFSTYIPFLKPLQYLFLPYYYLNTLSHFKSGIVSYTAFCLSLYFTSIIWGHIFYNKHN